MKNTPSSEINKEWEDIVALGLEGPTVEEYFTINMLNFDPPLIDVEDIQLENNLNYTPRFHRGFLLLHYGKVKRSQF
ncbi:MAG: hypothetical protein IPN36_16460 [Bacteroidetes bacterium]|nr:hypothetical protein [Bacteroidota bacterium]